MSESNRCGLTELLTEQCAHCKGDKGDAIPGVVGVERSAIANFDGRCALNPRHRISPGETIGYTGTGWICEACTEVTR